MIESVYKDRDNFIILILRADKKLVDLSGVTKIELFITQLNLTITSTTQGIFEWGSEKGKLIIKLGDVQELPYGIYSAELYVYDYENDDGIYWDTFSIDVK